MCFVCLRLVVFDTLCVVFVYVWWYSTHVVFCLFTYGGVRHMLCCVCLRMVVFDTCCVVFVYVWWCSSTCCVVFVYVWWCSTHVVLCLFTYGGVRHMLCCAFVFIFLRLVCTVLSVSLDCPFLIAPSVFSNVYSKLL
jgi:hypothetical protein